MSEIDKRMKEHDYFHEYSDDQKEWRVGAADFMQIIAMMAELPREKHDELLAMVPVQVRPRWVEYLNIVLERKGKR